MGCFLKHQWKGCTCEKCGKERKHDYVGGACNRCGHVCGHSWVLEKTAVYGGNDVNGWGPGGSTSYLYSCAECGATYEESVNDDDDGD